MFFMIILNNVLNKMFKDIKENWNPKKRRNFFDTNTLLTLYYSFISPYLNYGVHMWGYTYETYVNKTVLLQKKTVWILHGVKCRAHSEPLFSQLWVPSVSNVYMYNVMLDFLCTKPSWTTAKYTRYVRTKLEYSPVWFKQIKCIACSMLPN